MLITLDASPGSAPLRAPSHHIAAQTPFPFTFLSVIEGLTLRPFGARSGPFRARICWRKILAGTQIAQGRIEVFEAHWLAEKIALPKIATEASQHLELCLRRNTYGRCPTAEIMRDLNNGLTGIPAALTSHS
jgi:hypothetical protein